MSKEISITEIIINVKSLWNYLWSKSLRILLVAFIFGILGITYAWLQNPSYTAVLTFMPEGENSSPMSAYASIASQFGIDIGSSKNSFFDGDNLAEIMRSDMLIKRTLLTPVSNNNKTLLINYYVQSHELNKTKPLTGFEYSEKNLGTDRLIDSIFNNIVQGIRNSPLTVSRLDKKVTIWKVSLKDVDPVFASSFVEHLTSNTIAYYIDYKSKKARANVEILQIQLDSVKRILSGNIVEIANTNDLNVNPTKQIVRTGTSRKQVDLQANTILYGELVKQLEVGKVLMRKETPFIQILDRPALPLAKEKLGRLKGGILFAFIGGILFILFLIGRREYKKLVVRQRTNISGNVKFIETTEEKYAD